MKELNNDILKNALKGLQRYDPDTSVWDNLEKNLQNQDWSDNEFPTHLLNQYSPSDTLWDSIEEQIPSKKPIGLFSTSWIKYAALFAIIVGLGFILASNSQSDQGVISYSEETIASFEMDLNFNDKEDQKALLLINQSCQRNAVLCNQSDFKTLRKELEELDFAKRRIENALNAYAQEPQLISELAKIERERNMIINKLIRFI